MARLNDIKAQAARVRPTMLRDTAEERLFNALKSIIYCAPMTSEDFRQYAQDISQTALEEWNSLRSPELNCHGYEEGQ